MYDFTGLFIILCWVVNFTYVAIKAFRTKPTTKSFGGGWRILGAVVFILAVCLFLLLPSRPLANIRAPTLVIGIVADVIAFLGLIVVLWARRVLAENWSLFAVIKESHELVKTGPYRYVRHPMYSGLLLLILGSVVWFDNMIGFIVFCLAFIGFWMMGRQEEKLLPQRFPEEYPAYKKHTKALIPFVL